MRHSASVTAAAMFVTLADAASAGTSESVHPAPVHYAFEPPPASLLSVAHTGLVRTLVGEQGAAFARETLPKIDDHMHRAEALLAAETGTPGSR